MGKLSIYEYGFFNRVLTIYAGSNTPELGVKPSLRSYCARDRE